MNLYQALHKFEYVRRRSWLKEDYIFYDDNGVLRDDGNEDYTSRLRTEDVNADDWIQVRKPRSFTKLTGVPDGVLKH